jgi:hypothetical protein
MRLRVEKTPEGEWDCKYESAVPGRKARRLRRAKGRDDVKEWVRTIAAEDEAARDARNRA